jgi:hypothetical protein
MSGNDFGPFSGIALMIEGGAKLIGVLFVICVVLVILLVTGGIGGAVSCLHRKAPVVAAPNAQESARLFLVDNTRPIPSGFRCYEWTGGSYRCPVSTEVNVLCQPRPRGFTGYLCGWERTAP